MSQTNLADLPLTQQMAIRVADDLYWSAVRARCQILDGPERYDRLVSRVESAAMSSRTVADWIEHACTHLELGSVHGPALMEAVAAPAEVQEEVLSHLRERGRTVVMWVRELAAGRRAERKASERDMEEMPA